MYIGYQQVEVAQVVKDVTAFTLMPAGTQMVELQCAASAGSVAYTMDGATSPGAQRGMFLAAGHPPKAFRIEDFKRIKFVCVDDSPTHLHAHFIGRA